MSGESLIFILMWWCNYEMQISFGVTLEHVVAIYTFLLYLDVVGALFRQGFLVVVCVVWGFLLVGCCVFSCFLFFFKSNWKGFVADQVKLNRFQMRTNNDKLSSSSSLYSITFNLYL